MSDEDIVAAYRETGSIWAAGKRIGLCGQSVHERLQRLGFHMAHEEWSEAELREAQRLAVQGEPLAQIAARLGRTYTGVALKLSRTGVGSAHTSWRWKPKRTRRITRSRVHALARLLNEEGWSVRRLARREGLAITPLVDALQVYETKAWHRYVASCACASPRACPGCGTQFLPLTGKQRYCTVRCQMGHRRNLAYFGGRRSEAVGLKDGVCQLCRKKFTKWLAAHHVFGKENDPDNDALIALCRGCHDLVTRLAARPWIENNEVVADLIALALAGRGKAGASVAVDIEKWSVTELEAYMEAFAVTCEGTPHGKPMGAADHDRLADRRGAHDESPSPLPGIHLSGVDHLGRLARVHLGRDGVR